MFVLRILCVVVSFAVDVQLHGADRTKARLLLSSESARPGDTLTAAIELVMPGKWHTYWKNAGDSGTPTRVHWQLPAGISAGEIQWPIPDKHTEAGLTTYVYSQRVLLLVPITLAKNRQPGTVTLEAKVSWLECAEVCLPGGGSIQVQLAVGSALKESTDAKQIAEWQARLPRPGNHLQARAQAERAPNDDTLPIRIEFTTAPKPADVDFFPYAAEEFEVTAPTERLPNDGPQQALRKVIKRWADTWPKRVDGLIVITMPDAQSREAYEVSLPLASAP